MENTIPHVAHAQYRQFYALQMNEWRDRFRAHMRQVGMSQEALGEALGRTQGAIGHWLRGRNQINLNEFLELCKAAKADPVEILQGTRSGPNIDTVFQTIARIWEHADSAGQKWIEEAARFVARGHISGQDPAGRGAADTRLQAPKPRREKKPKVVRIPPRRKSN